MNYSQGQTSYAYGAHARTRLTQHGQALARVPKLSEFAKAWLTCACTNTMPSTVEPLLLRIVIDPQTLYPNSLLTSPGVPTRLFL